MIDITRDWLTEENKPIFAGYDLTAAYPKLVMALFDILVNAVERRSPSLSEEERKQLSELVAGLDNDFDHQDRVIDKACDLFALAVPDQRGAYKKASGAILPDGLAVINTSYRNEAGETERIVERVDADEQVRQTLEITTLNGVKLKDWYDRLVDAGRRIGPLATRLDVTRYRAEKVVLKFKARQRWTTIVTTLQRSAFLAEWTEEHMEWSHLRPGGPHLGAASQAEPGSGRGRYGPCPRKMRFGISEGMVLAATSPSGIFVLGTDDRALPGAKVS